jgi:hypothetical protein
MAKAYLKKLFSISQTGRWNRVAAEFCQQTRKGQDERSFA